MPVWLQAIAWVVLIMSLPALFIRPITKKELQEDFTLKMILAAIFIAVVILIIHFLIPLFR